MKKFSQLVSVALMLGVAGAASAVPVTLQPGPEGKDAQLVNGSLSSSNIGNSQFLMDNWGGNLRAIGLVQFDLSSIPSGSAVSSHHAPMGCIP